MPEATNGRDIKKKRSAASLGGKTTSDPPSPTLSAVHASGVSTPVPKLKLSGTTATSSASSSLLLKKNGTEPGSVDDKKPTKPQMKLPKDEEEDLTQSRWFVRTWPLRSTIIPKVAAEPIKRESRPPTPPPAVETTTSSQDSVGRDEAAGTATDLGAAGKDALAETSNTANAPPETVQPTASVEDTSNIQVDSSGKPTGSDTESNTQQGWIGWLWYGSQQPAAPTVTPDSVPPKEPELPNATTAPEPTETIVPDSAPVGTDPTPEVSSDPRSVPATTELQSESTPTASAPAPTPAPARSSWFGLWGGYPAAQSTTVVVDRAENTEGQESGDVAALSSSNELTATTIATTAPVPAPAPASATAPAQEQTPLVANGSGSTVPEEQNTKVPDSPPSKTPIATSSGWSFWYRSGGSTTATANTDAAVEPTMDTTSAQALPPKGAEETTPVLAGPSQSQPTQPAKVIPVAGPKSDVTAKDKNSPVAPTGAKAPAPTPAPAAPSPAVASPAVNKLQRICPPNHVFPDFDACYNLLEAPPFYCKLTRLFKKPPLIPKNHLFRVHAPRQVKKAVAIGVHGFFPMRLVRTVLGEPTGTSVRFAQSAAAAIKRWAEQNGVEIEIETVALEGEGKVADRVDMLWKLLEKWMDHVKNADFVMIGAHSQGVVVGLQLLARMIEQGWVDNARVGVAAMAGINLGPFYHLPTSILTGSAKELFEFQRPESAVSKKYIQALRIVLAHDVRIVFIGSIDDQLVPLESSTFSNIHHPYIYRAVFVDGRVHAPNFLSHLVGFAMKLRNLGISDHGLIRQLSIPLAGSLYGGEGHSRIYDDDRVYDIAVRHALETTDCPDVPLRVDPFELPTTNNNPFFLPWAMRGLLEESFVRTKLEDEKNELLQQFEDWKPTSKVLKDVKFRLEGINQTRSKL